MIVKIERIAEGTKNKYLHWMGNPEDILKFLSTVDHNDFARMETDDYLMWYLSDNLVPEGIKTNLTEDYYRANHLSCVKAKYLEKKLGLPMSITYFFSYISPAELLQMDEPSWILLTRRERMFVLQAAVAVKDENLVKDLLTDCFFADLNFGK
jgi:hypothetical protein